MKRMHLAALGLSIVAITAVASGSGVIAMRMAAQSGAPAALTMAHHTNTDLLKSARAHNNSNKRIMSYRIGWAYVLPGKVDFHRGPAMNVQAGIAPDTDFDIPAQAVPFNSEANAVIFFVAEVTFADGSQWKVNERQIWPALANR